MRLWLLALVLLPVVVLAEYPSYETQTHLNPWFFYNADGTVDTTGTYRFYVDLADSSDSDNQFDLVYDPSYGCHVTYSPPDRIVSGKIYKIDGADVLIYNGVTLIGGKLPVASADATVIKDGAIETDHLAPASVTSDKLAPGAVNSSALGAGSAWENLRGGAPTLMAQLTGGIDIDSVIVDTFAVPGVALISEETREVVFHAEGDSTDRVDVREGFLKLKGYAYQFPGFNDTTEDFAFEGATEDMIFVATFADRRDADAYYLSPGMIRIEAEGSGVADSVRVFAIEFR